MSLLRKRKQTLNLAKARDAKKHKKEQAENDAKKAEGKWNDIYAAAERLGPFCVYHYILADKLFFQIGDKALLLVAEYVPAQTNGRDWMSFGSSQGVIYPGKVDHDTFWKMSREGYGFGTCALPCLMKWGQDPTVLAEAQRRLSICFEKAFESLSPHCPLILALAALYDARSFDEFFTWSSCFFLADIPWLFCGSLNDSVYFEMVSDQRHWITTRRRAFVSFLAQLFCFALPRDLGLIVADYVALPVPWRFDPKQLVVFIPPFVHYPNGKTELYDARKVEHVELVQV